MNDHLHRLVVETEEYLTELNRVMQPFYVDGFKRWGDVRCLVLATAKAYLDPKAPSVYTRVQERHYSDTEMGIIMAVVGRLDEELRHLCQPYLEDCVYVSVRQPVDKPYLIIEFAVAELPQSFSFSAYINQLQDNGNVIDPKILRAVEDYESRFNSRRALRYRRRQ